MSTTFVIDYQPGLGVLKMKLRSFDDGGFTIVNASESPADTGNYVGGFVSVSASDLQDGFACVELWDSANTARLTKRVAKATIDATNYMFGPTDYHGTQLDRIEAATAQITLQGSTIVVNSAVSEGGTLTVYKGSDYRVRNNTALTITIPDVGGSLAAILKDDTKVESILFGAGRGQSANEITGTIDADNVTYNDDNTTTIDIEITQADTACASPDDYEWHAKGVAPVVDDEADGDEAIRLEGTLELKPERART